MLKGNMHLLHWDMEDEEEFAVTVPGSPLTKANYFNEDPNCGHNVMKKAFKAFGVVSHEGLRVAGAGTPTMKDYSELFRLDIEAFQKSDDELASLFVASYI